MKQKSFQVFFLSNGPIRKPSSRARICKPFKDPRNRFTAWRNRFLGIDSWAPKTFKNTGSGMQVRHLSQEPFCFFVNTIDSWAPKTFTNTGSDMQVRHSTQEPFCFFVNTVCILEIKAIICHTQPCIIFHSPSRATIHFFKSACKKKNTKL